jgi:hypothetical protein
MTLIIQKPTGAKLVFSRTQLDTRDADANAYMTAVQTADGQPLELGVRLAITDFVVGCKADGIWPAIKASCILAGARTLTGALVPLVGTAPTNVNFVSGDYNRKTGLVGNGSSKYLNSNRAGNADPQNNHHASVYATSANTGTKWYMGSESAAAGSTNLYSASGTDLYGRSRHGAVASPQRNNSTGLIAMTRASSATWTLRSAGGTTAYSINSEVPASTNYGIFVTISSPISSHADARLAFYSIGESLDLALLDARVTDLINAFAAAIP